MKIAVLNGSPKGDNSITLQYARYIGDHFPQHEWKAINIGTGINKLEKTPEAFQEIIESVRSSDAVLWAFPLYFLLVCGQMKRFIELIFENKAESAFRGKYAASISTSAHVFDHTAHNYVRAISEDLGMQYFGGYAAEMGDLHKADERLNLLKFGEGFLYAIENTLATTRSFEPVAANIPDYVPNGANEKPKSGNRRITLATDSADMSSNLGRMIDVFVKSIPNPVDVVDLSKVDIKGGCLGCIHCAFDNECVYHDGYRSMFEEKIKTADAVVFAGTIVDRYLSSRWKIFFDRSFYNGHIPVLMGKQVACIISGPLSRNANLRQVLESYFQVMKGSLVGIATDECKTSAEVTSRIEALAAQLVWSLEKDYVPPTDFLGISGHILLRDWLFAQARFPFLADHRFYKKHGLYDLPHKKIKSRLKASLFCLLCKIPAMRRNVQRDMVKHMVDPFRKYVRQDTGHSSGEPRS